MYNSSYYYIHILVTYGDCQVGKYPGFAIFNFSISAGVHYPPSSLLADLAALVVSPLSDWLKRVALIIGPVDCLCLRNNNCH